MRRDYSPAFLALIFGGIAVMVLGLLLVTAHSQARPESLSKFSAGHFFKNFSSERSVRARSGEDNRQAKLESGLEPGLELAVGFASGGFASGAGFGLSPLSLRPA